MALEETVGASPEPSKTGRGAAGRTAHGMLSCPAGSSHALQDTLLAVVGVAIWMDTNLDFRMATFGGNTDFHSVFILGIQLLSFLVISASHTFHGPYRNVFWLCNTVSRQGHPFR